MMRTGRSVPAGPPAPAAIPPPASADARRRAGEPPTKRARRALLGCARRPLCASLALALLAAAVMAASAALGTRLGTRLAPAAVTLVAGGGVGLVPATGSAGAGAEVRKGSEIVAGKGGEAGERAPVVAGGDDAKAEVRKDGGAALGKAVAGDEPDAASQGEAAAEGQKDSGSAVMPVAHRVVVVVPQADAVSPKRLETLLASLSSASYPDAVGRVGLDVYVRHKEATSFSELLGLAGAPPEQAAVHAAVDALRWPYGPKTVAEYAATADWAARLRTTSVTLVFADMATLVSPAYHDFVREATAAAVGASPVVLPPAGAPVLAVALDSLVPAAVEGQDVAGEDVRRAREARAARSGTFFPAVSAFAPTPEAWRAFVSWLQLRMTGGGVEMVPTQGGFPTVAKPVTGAMMYDWEDDVRVLFAEFLHLYGGHVIHPIVPDGELLVIRDPVSVVGPEDTKASSHVMEGATGPESASSSSSASSSLGTDSGTSSPSDSATPLSPLHLVTKTGPRDLCCKVFIDSVHWRYPVPSRLPLLSLDGKPLSDKRAVPVAYPPSILSATKTLPSVPAMSAEEAKAQQVRDVLREEAVERIAKYAALRGEGVIAFTLVTEAFVETTYSWVCNVLAVDALPKALVFGASDANVVRSLESLFVNDTRLSPNDVMIIDLSSAVQAVESAETRQSALDFGTSEYWQLMLERTTLLRDVLDAGVAILHFETDQIWFGDPMISINALLANPMAGNDEGSSNNGGDAGVELSFVPRDLVLTINTREEASGNFFFLRPTLATRHLWSLVTSEFWASYRRSRTTKEAIDGKFHYIDNDQSLFTRYGLGNDAWFRVTFPAATHAVLDRQRFLDGTWYQDFEDSETKEKPSRRSFYTSDESLAPVVLNNNFMIGVTAKKERAIRFGHWFWDEEKFECNSTRGAGPGKVPVTALSGHKDFAN